MMPRSAMRHFREFPIRRKLTLITVAISGVALLLACGVFAWQEQANFRRTMARDLGVLANIFADNVASGLAFNDPASMEQTLRTLAANPRITGACVYDSGGTIVARYDRDAARTRFAFPGREPDGQRFLNDRLETFRTVMLAGEPIGAILVASDLSELHERAWRYLTNVGMLLVGCSLAAWLLAWRLQKIISGPIVRLAETAALVAVGRNYAVRAVKTTHDEVGALIDGFNEMLTQIQVRDAELEAARDQLERRVEERTRELERENADRRRAESALRESQALYHSLVEQMSAGVFCKDREGRYIFVNSWFSRLTRTPVEQFIGRTGAETAEIQRRGRATDEAEASQFAADAARDHDLIMRTGQRLESQERYFDPEGRVIHLHVVKSPVFDPDGTIVGSQGVLLDITELKRAQDEAAREHARFKFIFDAVPVGLTWMKVGAPDTRIVNAAFAHITGVPLERCRELELFRAATHPEDQARQDMLHARLSAGETDHYECEKRYLRPDGSYCWAALSVRVFRDVEDGSIEEIATLVDIDERRRSEAKLAHSLSVLHATLESTVDGILVADLHGRVTVFNRKFAEMWRVPLAVLEEGNDEKVLAIGTAQLKNPPAFFEKVKHLYAQPDAESFDVLEFADGRMFERYSQPQRIDGVSVGRVWCFRDITERRRAEAELELTHRQLLLASRQAGMAEVATGVLHNVGNVLNSVNVSTILIADLVRLSKIDRVAKLRDLLAQHRHALGAFFDSDPRGKQVIGYLETLAGHLENERNDTLREIESLRKNVEHIKDIVAMQQSYAKVSGVAEKIAVADLVEDAIRMNAGALTRHDISLVRDYRARPTVTVDKHKVLQILVNLIRNAKYACDEAGRIDKQMIVRVAAENSRVRISVVDNGVGIPEANLARIFQHGFTTRKHGHGFGLHSGALAAKELGGALTAHSDGPGRGATFTLELGIESHTSTS
jgi:PAS domain S-box-containing protein